MEINANNLYQRKFYVTPLYGHLGSNKQDGDKGRGMRSRRSPWAKGGGEGARRVRCCWSNITCDLAVLAVLAVLNSGICISFHPSLHHHFIIHPVLFILCLINVKRATLFDHSSVFITHLIIESLTYYVWAMYSVIWAIYSSSSRWRVDGPF